jgi:hypothetical protein
MKHTLAIVLMVFGRFGVMSCAVGPYIDAILKML